MATAPTTGGKSETSHRSKSQAASPALKLVAPQEIDKQQEEQQRRARSALRGKGDGPKKGLRHQQERRAAEVKSLAQLAAQAKKKAEDAAAEAQRCAARAASAKAADEAVRLKERTDKQNEIIFNISITDEEDEGQQEQKTSTPAGRCAPALLPEDLMRDPRLPPPQKRYKETPMSAEEVSGPWPTLEGRSYADWELGDQQQPDLEDGELSGLILGHFFH